MRYCSCQESYNNTMCVRTLFTSLCASRIMQTLFMSLCASKHYSRHCLCHYARQNIVHVTVHIIVRVKTLFTSLFMSLHVRTLFTYCRSIFYHKKCQCTIHDTVHAILTAKTIGALFMTLWRQSGPLKLLA